MTIPLFPRLVALGLFVLTSGVLHAASKDSDAVPDYEQASSPPKTILIPYDYLPSGLYDPDVDAQPAQPTGSIPLVPGTQANPLLSAIEKQRDEALKKAQEGKSTLAQQARQIEAMKKLLAEKNAAETEAQEVEARLAKQAQEMADLMALLNPSPKPKSIPQPTPVPPNPASLPQASASASIPRPVVDTLVIPEVARGYEDIYRRFLGGKLIYTDPSSKAKKELPIRALANPLEGTFDLSGCGDTGQYLSIATGYRKCHKVENDCKVEIWLAPRFVVDRDLASTARHLQPIMGIWDAAAAPIGLFWNYNGWSDLGWYDYLVTNSMDELSSEDLHEKYKKTSASSGSLIKPRVYVNSIPPRFQEFSTPHYEMANGGYRGWREHRDSFMFYF